MLFETPKFAPYSDTQDPADTAGSITVYELDDLNASPTGLVQFVGETEQGLMAGGASVLEVDQEHWKNLITDSL